jgi:drug/metabolite transporter (DMT)-like permease
MTFAHLITKDDKLNRWKILSLALFIIGLVFMIRPWDIQEGNTVHGVMFTIFSSAIFGLYTVAGGKIMNRAGVFNLTAICFFVGAFVVLMILLVTGRPVFEGTGANLAIVLYFGIVITGVGYLLFFLAIKYSNASTTSLTFFLKPAIAPIFAVAILGEVITYNMYIGIALVLVASYIMTFKKHSSF